MSISFEFFPPRTPKGLESLLGCARALSKQNPSYFSVTYGAGGSTRDTTLNTVQQLQQRNYTVVPHIACFGSSKAEINSLLQHYKQRYIKNILCLRGDPPSGVTSANGDFRYAVDLINYVREVTGDYFDITTAVYPEAHPQATNIEADLLHFKDKVSAGASKAITQYFYDPNAYYRLLEDCTKLGVNIPIIPGIMPIRNYSSLRRFSDICGAEIPKWIEQRLIAYADDIDSIQQFGIEVVTKLCEQVLAYQAPELHFYTLNKSDISEAIINNLQLNKDTQKQQEKAI